MKKSQNKHRKRKIVLGCVTGVFALALVFCLAQDVKDTFLYHKLAKEVTAEEEKKVKNKSKSSALPDYKDMVGWLEIPNTNFSYPVMQTKDDAEYYLHRDVNGNYSFYGTPFLDARCSITSDNMIVYGHNINGRRFFGYLQNYRSKSFYDAHPQLTFTKVLNKDEEGNCTFQVEETYDILAVLLTDTSSVCYRQVDYTDEQEYMDFVFSLVNSSIYQTDVTKRVKEDLLLSPTEFFHKYQFLALSTCRTGEGRDKRLLVVGCRNV